MACCRGILHVCSALSQYWTPEQHWFLTFPLPPASQGHAQVDLGCISSYYALLPLPVQTIRSTPAPCSQSISLVWF